MHGSSIIIIYIYFIRRDGTVRQLFKTLCKRIDIIIKNIILHTGCVFPDATWTKAFKRNQIRSLHQNIRVLYHNYKNFANCSMFFCHLTVKLSEYRANIFLYNMILKKTNLLSCKWVYYDRYVLFLFLSFYYWTNYYNTYNCYFMDIVTLIYEMYWNTSLIVFWYAHSFFIQLYNII